MARTVALDTSMVVLAIADAAVGGRGPAIVGIQLFGLDHQYVWI
jgi:hypothetical protein